MDEFNGTLVVVSHDRYFLDRVVDRTLAMDGGRLRAFDGGYSAYAELTGEAWSPDVAS